MNLSLDNIIGIIGVLMGAFISYHLYFLSQKLELKDKLIHKDNVRNKIEPILEAVGQRGSSDIELINAKKYFKHYPDDNSLNKNGYTYLKGELKALQFDGVELFCGVKELYRKPDGRFSLSKEGGAIKENYNVFEVGVIPYEWIEYVDGRGDEFSYRPQFFINFKGFKKSPYKYFKYYIEDNAYCAGREPIDLKWKLLTLEL
jgi:hypothetical protein